MRQREVHIKVGGELQVFQQAYFYKVEQAGAVSFRFILVVQGIGKRVSPAAYITCQRSIRIIYRKIGRPLKKLVEGSTFINIVLFLVIELHTVAVRKLR